MPKVDYITIGCVIIHAMPTAPGFYGSICGSAWFSMSERSFRQREKMMKHRPDDMEAMRLLRIEPKKATHV